MGQLARFETCGLDSSERLLRWGEFLSRQPGRLVTQSRGTAPFTGLIETASVGPLRLFHIQASAHHLSQPAHLSASRDVVRLLFQVRGESLLSQGGAQVTLRPGQWAAWNMRRPHAVDNPTPVEQVGLLIPGALLGVRGGDILRHGTSPQGEQAGIGRLLYAQVLEVHRQIAVIEEPFRTELADVLLHMLRLALSEVDSRQPKVTTRDTMRARLIDFVCRNLRDPDLSIEKVAAKFDCSKRYVHKVFRGDGQTLSQFVWQERLERCRKALVEPDLAGRSITEIAFMWGFNSSTHFSKLFKARYGVSPSQFRACPPQSPSCT